MTYKRTTVEALLPTLWDESFAYGMSQENSPDPQMPKAKANPAHGNVLGAMMADIQRAWGGCDVPNTERRALLLHYGMGWTQKHIGAEHGVTQQGAQLRIERGVGRLTAWLNGDTYHDNYDDADASVHVCDKEESE